MVSLNLPIPPPKNGRIMLNGKGLPQVHSRENGYKELVGWECLAAKIKPMVGNLKISCTFYYGRPRDIDSGFSCLLDALQGFCFYNDHQIVEARLKKNSGHRRPHVHVELEHVPDAPKV